MKLGCLSTIAVAVWGMCQAVASAHAVTFTPLIVDGPKVGQNVSIGTPAYLWFYEANNDASFLKIFAFDAGGPDHSISVRSQWYREFKTVDESGEVPSGEPYTPSDPFVFLNNPPSITKEVYIAEVGGVVVYPAGLWFLTVTLNSQDPEIFFQVSSTDPTITPLPAALPLFATGLGALGLLGWRRKRYNAAAALAA